MLTTRSGSCAALSLSLSLSPSPSQSSSCPNTSDVVHHQEQHQENLQVKKLFETWPVKGRRLFTLATEVEPEVACCATCGGGGGGGGGGVGRRRRLQTPMSDVCPYPLQGNFATAVSTDVDHPHQQPRVVERLAPSSATTCARYTMDNNCYSLDLERIVNTVNKLDVCGWYYGRLSWQQATDLLKSKQVGTFLLRDSSDPLFLFALSVQTERGPTSVRIHYGDGQFKLDAETNLFGTMPLFDCVVQLVDYYVQLSQSDKSKAHVWLDDSGRRDLPVRLSLPLYCRVPQLQHLSRLAINQSVLAASGRLPGYPLQRLAAADILPNSLLSFIREYPYQR